MKLAVHNKIQELNSAGGQDTKDEQIELSTRHQVVCTLTAIIGVMAQKDKNSNEVKEHSINFNRNGVPERPPI